MGACICVRTREAFICVCVWVGGWVRACVRACVYLCVRVYTCMRECTYGRTRSLLVNGVYQQRPSGLKAAGLCLDPHVSEHVAEAAPEVVGHVLHASGEALTPLMHTLSENRGVEVGVHVDAAVDDLDPSSVAAEVAGARAAADLHAVNEAREGLHGGALGAAVGVALAVRREAAGVATRHGALVARSHCGQKAQAKRLCSVDISSSNVVDSHCAR